MIIKKKFDSFNLRKLLIQNGPLEITLLFFLCLLLLYKFYLEIVLAENQAVRFSLKSGIYREPAELQLKSYVLNSKIRYTKDGSIPTINSDLYSESLLIHKTTTLTAGLFRNNDPIGKVTYQTIFINENTDLPIIALTTDPKNLWDEKTGIYVDKNDRKKGAEWEKSGTIEFFEPHSQKSAFSKTVDFRIYGGDTRNNAQKSLKLCTNQNDSIIYELFPGYEVTKFKCLLLRNSGGDWTHTLLRDAFMQGIIRDNSMVTTQNYRPAVLFINGEYWGIHNIREYYNDNYFSNKYLGRRQDYAILFPNRDNKGRPDVEAGSEKDAKDFENLRKLVKSDVNDPKVLDEIKSMMDIDNFIDYNIFETYFANYDWMDSNIKIWRYNGIDSEENQYYGNDGKFRWMVYDLDAGFAIADVPPYRRNILQMATIKKDYSGREWPYVILRRLILSEEIQTKFINKYADYLNSTFLPENVIDVIDKYEDQIEAEIPRHIEKWKGTNDAWGHFYMEDVSDWNNNVQKLHDFALERPQYAYQHVIEQFNLEGTYKINLTDIDSKKGNIRINSLKINNKNWQGTYFDNVPLEIEVIPNNGHSFFGWEGNINSKDKLLILNRNSDVYLKPIFN